MDMMSLHVEEAKQTDLAARLEGHLAAGRLTRDEARSLTGSLQFVLFACTPSRHYLKRLYGAINTTSSRSNMITLSPQLRSDLEMLLDILKLNPGKAYFKTDPRVVIFTDAALSMEPTPTGHGGFYVLSADEETVRFGHFEMPACVLGTPAGPLEENVDVSSTLLELVGACVALDTLIRHTGIADRTVAIACDNLCLVHALTAGRAVAPTCNRALAKLLQTAAAAQITLLAVHLRRTRRAIQIADSLSRAQQEDLRAAFPNRPMVELLPQVADFRLA
jgi:hypothetical protein